jgi:hypothetical protein
MVIVTTIVLMLVVLGPVLLGRFTLYNFCLQLSHAIVAYDCRKLLKHPFIRLQLYSCCIELSTL